MIYIDDTNMNAYLTSMNIEDICSTESSVNIDVVGELDTSFISNMKGFVNHHLNDIMYVAEDKLYIAMIAELANNTSELIVYMYDGNTLSKVATKNVSGSRYNFKPALIKEKIFFYGLVGNTVSDFELMKINGSTLEIVPMNVLNTCKHFTTSHITVDYEQSVNKPEGELTFVIYENIDGELYSRELEYYDYFKEYRMSYGNFANRILPKGGEILKLDTEILYINPDDLCIHSVKCKGAYREEILKLTDTPVTNKDFIRALDLKTVLTFSNKKPNIDVYEYKTTL